MPSKQPVDNLFKQIPRKYFLPTSIKDSSDVDAPLPIGFGQTNSQPSTVYRMLSWLNVKQGDTVLDVGSGSGWTSALLSKLVGTKGKVTAVEVIPELKEFGENNCKNLGIDNISFYVANKHIGYPGNAPYNKILVSADASTLPAELIDQLADNGTLVIPIQSSIFVITKSNGSIHTTEHPGYAFVPLVNNI